MAAKAPAGERSELSSGAKDSSPTSASSASETEVVPTAKRRRFTAKYKLRILRQAEACTAPGQLGALLRREGLYSSHLSKWREQREQGVLQGLAPKKRGPKPDPAAKENQRLKRENERLQKRLKKAETIIEFQKKVSELLGISLETEESSEPRSGSK